MVEKIIGAFKMITENSNVENNNFARYSTLIFINSLIQIKGKEVLKLNWDFLLEQIVWIPVVQGSLLHSEVQSARFKLISRIFSSETE